MSTQPEALRLADRLDCGEISYSGMCKAAAELRRLHEVNQELLGALNNLCTSAYWCTEGGEFFEWVKDKTMCLAAAKELDELTEMRKKAKDVIAKAEGETK
jgi:hypothetical protein